MDDARFGVGPDDSEEYDESIPAPRVHLSPRIPALKRDSIKGSASEIGDALDEMGRELAALCRVSDEAGMVLEIAESAADVSPALRGKLAQLHGNAGQFVTRRLDTIVTGDMTSGRDEVCRPPSPPASPDRTHSTHPLFLALSAPRRRHVRSPPCSGSREAQADGVAMRGSDREDARADQSDRRATCCVLIEA
jgi:hypothetical protein